MPYVIDEKNERIAGLAVKRMPEGTRWVIHEKPESVNK